MQDLKRFAANLIGLAEIFGAEMSELKLTFYAKVLEPYTDDQIEAAIHVASATMKYFPKPVELIEIIRGKTHDRALIAWEQLLTAIRCHGPYQSVTFQDGRIAKAIELMGGWLEVCAMRVDETKFRMADFMKIYQGLSPCEPRTLMGIYEQTNRLHGFNDAIPEPAIIGENGHKVLLEGL